jgi:O-antigen/teichoic acid export membrane protein
LPHEAGGEKKSGVRKLGLLISFGMTATIFGLAPIIINEIFPKFIEAVDTVRIMILGAIPMTITSILLARLLGEEKTIPVLLSSAIFAVFQIPLLIILGDMYGTEGLAAATVTGLTIQTLSLLYIGKMSFANKPVLSS